MVSSPCLICGTVQSKMAQSLYICSLKHVYLSGWLDSLYVAPFCKCLMALVSLISQGCHFNPVFNLKDSHSALLGIPALSWSSWRDSSVTHNLLSLTWWRLCDPFSFACFILLKPAQYKGHSHCQVQLPACFSLHPSCITLATGLLFSFFIGADNSLISLA